jgi:hypothetical protein
MSYLKVNIQLNDVDRRRYERAWAEPAVRRRVAANASLAIRALKETLLPRLREAPPPRMPMQPIAWTSVRQRRAVMAFLRRTGNIPYQRTDRMRQGWKVAYEPSRERGALGTLSVANYIRGARAWPEGQVYYWQFVVGRAGEPGYQQGFHAAQGWYSLAGVLQDTRQQMAAAVGRAIVVSVTRKP